jgi:hypothetical protein
MLVATSLFSEESMNHYLRWLIGVWFTSRHGFNTRVS